MNETWDNLLWNHCKVGQAEHAEQAGNIRWYKQWRILCCYDEDVDEVLETMWIKEEPPINDEIQPIKTFGEFESATDFKGFKALHIIILNIKDQLLCFDVQTEAGHMYVSPKPPPLCVVVQVKAY